MAIAFPVSLHAQVAKPISPNSTTDKYGNAVPSYTEERRSVGSYQNEWQRSLTRGYQDFGRRLNPRGAYIPFSLPGDYQKQLFQQAEPKVVTPATSWFGIDREEAQRHYGGFGNRAATPPTPDLATSLRQREELITASAVNAPVYRAAKMLGTYGTLNTAMSRTPFVESNEPKPPADAASIDEHLQMGVKVDHDRIRKEAWDWFRLGQYRRAAHAFEAASQLDESDTESRIGEFFSYVSLASFRTALVVARTLSRVNDAPFLADLNIPAAFGDAKEVQRVRTQVALLAGPLTTNPEQVAMQALALWYMRAFDEAETVVQRLIDESKAPRYAHWLESMRQQRRVLSDDLQP